MMKQVAGGGVISGATSLGSNIYEFATVSGTDLTDNRRFTIATIDLVQTPLPITLLRFNAQEFNNTKVQLEWETSSELNNDYFTIERTLNGDIWEEVVRMDGAGNSTSIKRYQTFDCEPNRGVSYYRLKQTDFDGVSEYFDPVVVHLKNQEKRFSIHPNPSKESFYIRIGRTNSVTNHISIKIKDLQGRTVYSNTLEDLELKEEVLDLRIDHDFDPGLYLISLNTNEIGTSEKLIVKK